MSSIAEQKTFLFKITELDIGGQKRQLSTWNNKGISPEVVIMRLKAFLNQVEGDYYESVNKGTTIFEEKK